MDGRRAAAFPFAALLLTAVLLPAGVARSADAARTNFIVFLADDLGFSDVGCYGGEIPTPNIDALAEQGIRFTNFYNTGRCSPSRASLLTGLYPHQAGVGLLAKDKGVEGYQGVLNDRCVTVAEALRPAGYATLMVGKWHVGHERPHWPTDRGFDRFYGSPRSGGFYFRPDGDRLIVLDDRPVELDAEWYAPDRFGDYALEFLRGARAEGKPFFLYVAFMAPHYPLQARPEAIDRHRGRYLSGWEAIRRARFGRMVEMGIADARWRMLPASEIDELWQRLSPIGRRQVDERMATYAAQVEAMDATVGRILGAVRELGVEDDTLVMFLSDNGASSEGGLAGFTRGEDGAEIGTPESYASYGLAWARASNSPLHGFKAWVNEGGIASPLIAAWPHGISRPGELEDEVSHVIDILPTCLDVAGVPYPTECDGRSILPVEGMSLRPAFEGRSIERDAIFWEHRGNRAVRMGKWKLSGLQGADWRLYDLETDRTETRDVASMSPGRVVEMSRAYEAWAARAGVLPWEQVDAE